jgi:F-type H+-transporting ATPase subunit gamma
MAGSSMKDISIRIKSIKSTKQITKAMELVATSKLSKAKERVKKSRIFHSEVYSAMCGIVTRNIDTSSSYLTSREVKKSCYVIIAGDRGLAGGYNSNVFRFAKEQMEGKDVSILPIGRRTTEYYRRLGYEIISDEFSYIENLNVGSCYDIAGLLTNCFLKQEFDEVFVIYTNFVSVLSQQPASEFVLVEPSSNAVFNAVVPSYVAGMIWGSVNESLTSEFGARRTAMESATKNAEEMIDDLSLKYNRARQSSITQEITEIVAGSGLE